MESISLTQSNELAETTKFEGDKPLGFMARNFGLEPTSGQQKFDWVFGVGLPLVCVAADPIVFAGEHDLLYEYKLFAYVLSMASIMAMAGWLLWGQRLGELRPYLGGLFLTGSVISLIVGAILLPYSVFGMFFLIGFLGFTPLFSSFVYLRNSVRAINGAMIDSDTRAVYQAVILAALYALIVPFVLNY